MKSDFRYTFTVFTPSYNRATLLPRIYECLEKQTFRDFEWLIVDDGSKDNTAEVIKGLQSKASFPLRYVAKPNGGKHTAVNRAARDAEGYLIAILDSDDWFAPNALERFWHHWQAIPADQQQKFCGVTALFADPTGKIVGTKFPKDILDSDPIDLRYRYKVSGDKGGVLRTEVLRQFPYPEDVGRFVSESLVWNRMAKTYQTRFVNEALSIKEYQQGGLTDGGRLLQVRNTKATLLNVKELMELDDRLPIRDRVRNYANYVRHSLHQQIPFGRQISEAQSKAMFCLCYPMGLYLKIKDQRLIQAAEKA